MKQKILKIRKLRGGSRVTKRVTNRVTKKIEFVTSCEIVNAC
jgi:hypothetical protein